MKLLLVHGTRCLKTPSGEVYSLGRNPYSRYNRYLKHFDHVIDVSRMRNVDHVPSGLECSSGPNVSFVGIPDDSHSRLRFLVSREAKTVIKDAVSKADAVVIRNSRFAWLAAKIAQKRDIPWAVEVNSDTWDALWNYGGVLAKLYAPYQYYLARKWIWKAPYAIYVTNEYLQNRYPSQGITGGVSNVNISPVVNSVLERRLNKISYFSKKLSFDIGLIGSLNTRYKGLHVAMHAVALLKRYGYSVTLHQLGPGDKHRWTKEAERLGVNENIIFHGVVEHGSAVMEWLDGLDIYVQPSFQEGLPRSLIEAMSRGLPCLGSSCGGIPELLSHECLHAPGDHKKLAEQIQRFFDDDAFSIEMGEKNFFNAARYQVDILNAKRDLFWARFADEVRVRQLKVKSA